MLSSGKDSLGKDRKIAFVIPGGIKHLSEIQAVIDLIKQYSESHGVALDVTVSFGKSFFTVHQAGAGKVAELGDFCHCYCHMVIVVLSGC